MSINVMALILAVPILTCGMAFADSVEQADSSRYGDEKEEMLADSIGVKLQENLRDPLFPSECYDFVPVEKIPAPVKLQDPSYPEEALLKGVEAIVWICVLVDTNGSVKDAIIEKVTITNAGFGEAAKEAALYGEWEPAIQNNTPVPCWISYKVEFRIMAKHYLEHADKQFKSGAYDESRDVYIKAMEKAKQDGQNSELTESYAMIARTYLITDKKEDGREWIEKAGEIANDDEPLGWSRYLGVRGRFEWQDKELEKATATFEEVYAYCSDRKLHERAIDAAHMVAITGDHETQVTWAMKGIKEAEAGDIPKWLGPLWNNLGATYDEMGKYQESLDAYLRAREYHYQHGDERNKMLADWAVGHAYRLVGNLDDALQWMEPVLEWSERLEDVEFIGWSHKELGEIALARGDNTRALEHLVEAEAKLKEAGMPDWWPDEYEKLVKQIESLR